MNDSLISPDNLDRIARLEAEMPEDQEIQWLCQLARKLAALKPTDAEFPEYLALINHNVMHAIPIRFAERVNLQERELTWVGSPPSATLLEEVLSCNVTDAFLCVRPYVKLLSPESAGTREQLERLGQVTMYADDCVLFSGSLREILVGPDGYGAQRKPITLRYNGDPKIQVFGTGTIESGGGGPEATPTGHGVFLTHQTKVRVELVYPIRGDETLKFATGLVMARYTTKDSKYGGFFPMVSM